jgi:phosphopantothenoylcysteine decarboxylase/phosphopantothenate--cysteine ligase
MPSDPPAEPDAPARARRVLVTAGPTEEPIDAVRFIGNRSSGRMGMELARAFADAGCEVTLLLGPVRGDAPVHSAIRCRRFRTAAELASELIRAWPAHDVLVMAAAVADFRPSGALEGKIARGGSLELRLEPVPDLLAGLPRRAGAMRVGFALEEPARLRERARTKLAAKDLDAVVANPLDTMESGSIDATLVWRDGREERAAPGSIDKRDFARWLAGRILGAAPPLTPHPQDFPCASR